MKALIFKTLVLISVIWVNGVKAQSLLVDKVVAKVGSEYIL